ncbi:glycine cleavage system H-protein subunit [Microbotryomycetes sp. JL201]|nr:glycine cleavage system H-protein subunit [Microbotryomycetes sp. JL201]
MLFRTVVTKRFTTDHEWISFDSDSAIGTMGITEYAQKSLGDVVYVELPATQTTIAQGEQIGAVESVKAASDIFAPVSGEISEVNEALSDSPDLLNKSAEQDGWLAKIKLSNPQEFEALLSPEAYQAHCEGGEH